MFLLLLELEDDPSTVEDLISLRWPSSESVEIVGILFVCTEPLFVALLHVFWLLI